MADSAAPLLGHGGAKTWRMSAWVREKLGAVNAGEDGDVGKGADDADAGARDAGASRDVGAAAENMAMSGAAAANMMISGAAVTDMAMSGAAAASMRTAEVGTGRGACTSVR